MSSVVPQNAHKKKLSFTGCEKTLPGSHCMSGHDRGTHAGRGSRAAKPIKSTWALAPEACSWGSSLEIGPFSAASLAPATVPAACGLLFNRLRASQAAFLRNPNPSSFKMRFPALWIRTTNLNFEAMAFRAGRCEFSPTTCPENEINSARKSHRF
jgi:hypothetical protein